MLSFKNKKLDMNLPAPKRLDQVLSDKSVQYELSKPSLSTGKGGRTTKGRMAELRRLDPRSKEACTLRQAICTITVHRCGDCSKLFKYASERS